MGTFTKQDTKSGKSLVFRMNLKVRAILQSHWALLDESVESVQTSQFVFLRPLSGQRKLDSYLRHFRRIRDFAGIPEDYRPNYCLRDTIATRLLSSGLYLDEVAHRFGHNPGSLMNRRYTAFLASTQQNIADRSQSVLDEMLKWRTLQNNTV